MANFQLINLYLVFLHVICMKKANGHGIMLDPPSRPSAYRVGFSTPRNYNDMELFCGGFERQWLVNKGKCGICGDPYDEPIKPHEAPGGLFATGTIVRNYTQGQVIPVTIRLTATHKGFYEFRLCPNNNIRQDPTQECFDRFPLEFVDGQGSKTSSLRFNLTNLLPATYQLRLQLPRNVTCTQCIIQWTYVTGNRWGICPDGSGRLGCGPQETFRACADVAIAPERGREFFTSTPSPEFTVSSTTSKSTTPSSFTTLQPTTSTTTTRPPFQRPVHLLGDTCTVWKATSSTENVSGMTNWCNNNCQRGYCPGEYCICDQP